MENSVFAKMLHCNDWRSYGHIVPLMELASERSSLDSTILYADVTKQIFPKTG